MVGVPPSSSLPWPRPRGAHCHVRGSLYAPCMCAIGTRFQVSPPPLLPPLGGHMRSARANGRGGFSPHLRPLACRALGARAAQSRRPFLSPYASLLPSPLRPCSYIPLPGSQSWLDHLPSTPALVCRTRGASANRFWAWRRRCRWIAASGAPRYCYLPPCPSVGAAPPPSLAHFPFRRCRFRLRYPCLLGW